MRPIRSYFSQSSLPTLERYPTIRNCSAREGRWPLRLLRVQNSGSALSTLGTIGDDFRGNVQRQSLLETGVDITSLILRHECPNQTAYILIDQRTGERTVLWHRANCLRLSPRRFAPKT